MKSLPSVSSQLGYGRDKTDQIASQWSYIHNMALFHYAAMHTH